MEKKILVVDDSLLVREVLKDIFEGEDYHVLLAEDGEEGVKRAIQDKPDIVVTDTILPGINGFEVCRKIRELSDASDPRIIVMTGSVDAVDAIEARKAGADDYCVKTNDFSHLISIIKDFS